MRPSPLFPVTGLNNRFSGIASFNGFIAFLREVSILQYYANIIDFSCSHPHQWRHAITSSTVGDGAASSGACGPPSAWPVLRRLPWPRRFLATTIRGPEPGAHVLEPLPLTRIFGPPPDVSLRSLLSFFVFLYLSVCEALKLRSLPFTHPIYVASRYFQ